MTRCIACKKEIDEGARLCPHCKSHQAAWKNSLQYIAGVAVVLTLVSSAALYSFDKVSEIIAKIRWKDELGVVSFTMPGPLIVKNTGSGPTYLESVRVVSDEVSFLFEGPIDVTLEKGTFHEERLGKAWHGNILSGMSDEKWEQMKKMGYVRGQLMPIFFNEGSLKFRDLEKRLGDELRSFRGTAILTFHSIETEEKQSMTIPLTGVFVKLEAGSDGYQ